MNSSLVVQGHTERKIRRGVIMRAEYKIILVLAGFLIFLNFYVLQRFDSRRQYHMVGNLGGARADDLGPDLKELALIPAPGSVTDEKDQDGHISVLDPAKLGIVEEEEEKGPLQDEEQTKSKKVSIFQFQNILKRLETIYS